MPTESDGRRPGALTSVALFAIFLYQKLLSPLLPDTCRFKPSCSEYARLAYRKHGFLRGSWLTVGRLLRCQPFHPGGVDYP